MTNSALRQHIGRLFVVGMPGPALDSTTRRTLEHLGVGGVILFRRNLQTPEQIAGLTTQLHALPSRPLVAIDHEGGQVMRLGEPFTTFPAAAVVGSACDPNLTYRVGQAMAQELTGVGIDVDFAPVLDVHSNPHNPIIGDRAFGSNPTLVSDMGIAMMCGLLAGGVIPCGKHFPGHGDTQTDSHVELPVVRRTSAELEGTELVPFRAAIAAGVPMLMTAHVLYPALDPESPATVSRRIVTDLLRVRLRFNGVIATDDLAMRAITAHRDVGDASVAALDAGVDWLLVCQELSAAVRAFAAVEQAVADGSLATRVITAAAERIQRLQEFRAHVHAIACQLPNPEHRALAQGFRRA